MKQYPDKLLIMVDNMIRLHFCYEDMYKQIKVCFPKIKMSFNDMLDVVQDRVIKMI